MLLVVVSFVHIATILSSLCRGSNPGTVCASWMQSLGCFADYRLYKFSAELQEDQLGYPAVLAVSSSAEMPSCPSPSAADLYRGTSEVIPTSVWSVGDDPEEGKVHVVIDVSGA